MCVCNVCLPETLQTQIDNLEKSRLKQLHIVEARKATSEESNAQGLSSKTVSPLESCLLSPFILFSRKFSYSAQHTSDTGACDIVISLYVNNNLVFCFHVALQTKKRKKVTHANAPDEEVQRHTGDRKSRNWTKALTSEHAAFMLILNKESLYHLCKLQTCSSEMLWYYFSYLSLYLVIRESCYINFITLYKTQGPYFQKKDGRHMGKKLMKQCFNANVCHLSIYISVVRLSVLISVSKQMWEFSTGPLKFSNRWGHRLACDWLVWIPVCYQAFPSWVQMERI